MEIENLVDEPLWGVESLQVPTPTLKIIYGNMKRLQLKVKEEKGLWEPGFQSGNP